MPIVIIAALAALILTLTHGSPQTASMPTAPAPAATPAGDSAGGGLFAKQGSSGNSQPGPGQLGH
ncbi:MAG: hypothetical protein JO199_04475 [Candidatus Eremiobacteraeota bacterium]|nr:hypothetical protein [Candidatus Eremiobacteraeota bacterium]